MDSERSISIYVLEKVKRSKLIMMGSSIEMNHLNHLFNLECFHKQNATQQFRLVCSITEYCRHRIIAVALLKGHIKNNMEVVDKLFSL